MNRCVGIRTSSRERDSAPRGRKGSSLVMGEGKVAKDGGVENGGLVEQQPEVPNKVQSVAHVTTPAH